MLLHVWSHILLQCNQLLHKLLGNLIKYFRIGLLKLLEELCFKLILSSYEHISEFLFKRCREYLNELGDFTGDSVLEKNDFILINYQELLLKSL